MITVDATSFVPPYEQVRSQLAAQISGGDLVAGTTLPTVRRLAVDLGLAVNTVARAYRELEAAGLVATHGRAGTVVTAAGDASASAARDGGPHLRRPRQDAGHRRRRGGPHWCGPP